MFFAGLARGLNTALTTSRAEEAKLSEERMARETAILSHLATADDPDIASMAITGLMDQSAGRPVKGFGRLFGELASNPMLPRIRDLMAAGKQQTTTEAGPTRMPEGASAAMPPGPVAGARPLGAVPSPPMQRQL